MDIQKDREGVHEVGGIFDAHTAVPVHGFGWHGCQNGLTGQSLANLWWPGCIRTQIDQREHQKQASNAKSKYAMLKIGIAQPWHDQIVSFRGTKSK